jgi:small-conductance mechanosensitive channel
VFGILSARRLSWLVVLTVFLSVCGMASTPTLVMAQDGVPADANSPIEQMRADLEKARAALAKLTDAVESSKDDDARLVDLKAQSDDIAANAVKSSVSLRPRFEAAKTRLDELGEPPKDGQPPEAQVVTDERSRLIAERADINALTGEAEAVSTQASQLSNHVTDLRRSLFKDTLFKRTEISLDVFSAASSSLINEVSSFQRVVGSWWTFVWNYKKVQLLSAIFLSLLAAMLFLVGGYRFLGSHMERSAFSGEPGYIRRLSVAFWSTMVQSLTVIAFLVSSAFFLENFNVLRSDMSPIVFTAMGFTGLVYFVWRLTYAVFAPSHASWRLVRVSNTGARHLTWAVLAMTVVNGFDYLLSGISEALYSPVILTVVKSFVASMIVGIILIVMSFMRPVMQKDADPSAPGHRLPRWMGILFRLAGLFIIGACLTGYVGLARFVSTQIVVTGAVLATMYIGILSGKAISKQGIFADSVAGNFLQKRYGWGPVVLDQLGLVAGLGIYIVALAFGVPLILFSWGFQPADIENWAYRLLTGIPVGNTNISLLAVFGGIAIFALGYVITRWFQRWLDNNVMARSKADAGVRNSVKTGIGYLGIAIAAIFGISSAGLDLSNLALVASALSVGIGFGLQNIVSNFVSGLILLVERPFKVGDWVVTGATEGTVKRISVRATEIETFRRQSIIVPNSEFINSPVGNWTHRNRIARSEIPIGVSYDADPRKVIDILLELVRAQPLVLKNPEPHVEFVRFGDFSLDFEVRFFLADLSDGLPVRNQLRIDILTRFREEGIDIPFPQRNLNVHVDSESSQALANKLVEEGEKATLNKKDEAEPDAELKTQSELKQEIEGAEQQAPASEKPQTKPDPARSRGKAADKKS